MTMKKTERTLEYLKLLEKQNRKLERKLLIARHALNTYGNPVLWQRGYDVTQKNLEGFFSTYSVNNSFVLNPIKNGWELAQTALNEIKGTK
jgi:hypothetical protein